TVGTQPFRIKIADMNVGTPPNYADLVVVNAASLSVSVLLHDGVGGLTANTTSNSDLGGNPYYLDVGDVDADGDKDVVVSHWNSTNHRNGIVILSNNSLGTLTDRFLMSIGYTSFGVKFANIFTGDVRPALVTFQGWWGSSDNRILTYRNTGDSAAPYNFGNWLYANPPSGDATIYGAPVVGDVNTDGYMDIIAKVGGAASVLYGSSTGDFVLDNNNIPTGDTTANTNFGRQVVLTDFNGDSILDFATANWNNGAAGTLVALLGNGNGTFGSQTSFAVNQSGCLSTLGARSLDTADFNRDGKMDVAVATGCATGTSQVYVYFGYGDGTFNTTSGTLSNVPGYRTVNASGTYADVVLAPDVDGDGKPDLVVAGNNANLQYFRGDGAGAFGAASTRALGTAANILQLSMTEIDGDGRWDFVASSLSDTKLGIVFGNGTTLGAQTTISGMTDMSALSTYGMMTCDFDDDGKNDIILAKSQGYQLIKGNNNGSFTNPASAFLPPNAYVNLQHNLTPADVDGDGFMDIVNGHYSTSYSIGVTYNRSQ
ncbi:MAG: VCBS repeat-containing protein, partial [Bdellovibrionia bacterium]